ncbi:MAG: hypothetical protein IJ033_06290 [Clostridia bacterium]|nr:hypothetical protein [Clostridia bacterium]
MKTYIRFLAFTLSIGGLFVVAYLTSSLIDTKSQAILALNALQGSTPTPNGFMLLWGITYAFIVILLTATIANRCLRRAIKLWVILGVLNVLFCFSYFKLNLLYHGIALIITMLINLVILCNFYLKNTRYLWLACIPILANYCYSLFLSVVVCLNA